VRKGNITRRNATKRMVTWDRHITRVQAGGQVGSHSGGKGAGRTKSELTGGGGRRNEKAHLLRNDYSIRAPASKGRTRKSRGSGLLPGDERTKRTRAPSRWEKWRSAEAAQKRSRIKEDP